MVVEICSVRVFRCIWSENGNISDLIIPFDRIFEYVESDYEYIYAIRDSIDMFLDLKINDSINFEFNRDIKDCRGIVVRIK